MALLKNYDHGYPPIKVPSPLGPGRGLDAVCLPELDQWLATLDQLLPLPEKETAQGGDAMNWDLRRPGAFGAAYAYAAILDRASRWFPSGGEWWIYAGCPALAPKGRAWLKDR